MKKSRREFIRISGIAGAGLLFAPAMACNPARDAITAASASTPATTPAVSTFELPELGYAYSALEPHIDAMTMEIHHSKHHMAYVKNLNTAMVDNVQFAGLSIGEICKRVTAADSAIRNNAGGHWNHTQFWTWMRPGGAKVPSGALADAINSSFGSLENFLKQFSDAAKSRFGSGWAWLSADDRNSLFISSTPNQDNPLMKNLVEKPGTPILGIDVWEHAYYLKYQNRRLDYITAFSGLINWDEVQSGYLAALKG